jgi:hypothetical protein
MVANMSPSVVAPKLHVGRRQLRRHIRQNVLRCRAPVASWVSARHRSRSSEPREHFVIEASHGSFPVAGEGEDEEAYPLADAVGGGAGVGISVPVPYLLTGW